MKIRDNAASIFEHYFMSLNELNDEQIQSESEEEIIPVYSLKPVEVFNAFKNLDWSFADEDTTYLSHDIHPYPAKFPPQLPSQIIKLLSSVGETIWDPFGGSGTTALEALLCGRFCISTDINPIGSLIGRAKTTALCPDDESDLNRFIERLNYYISNVSSLGDFIEENKNDISKEIPAIPNIEKWFSSTVICELAFLKFMIKKELKSESSQTVAFASFSKIITRVSYQENETTYRAIRKEFRVGETVSIYVNDLCSNYSKIKNLSALTGYKTCTFITADVMEPIVMKSNEVYKGLIQEESVDLVVTSPPYPNAFDYHLYHRFRIFWLDGDPREMGKVEIGSHLKYQRNNSDFDQFENEMEPVLDNCYKALKSGRYAVFILGNAVFNGVEYETARHIGKLAQKKGFINIGIINRPLPENKRSVKSVARRATTEQILILKKPESPLDINLLPVKYRLWPYEQEISDMERMALCGEECNHFYKSGDYNTNVLKKLTFYSSYKVNGTEIETWQHLLEHSEGNDKGDRKEPKYLTHGIHPYKGKFYPQLVRPLLNILHTPIKGAVFDPFCGSGTVALESILNGYCAYGCDINPIAIETATAKTTIFKVTPYEFEKQISLFKEELKKYSFREDYINSFDQDAMDEIRNWFPVRVISKMGFILSKISIVPDERIRCFLRVILSSIIRDISQQDPSDLRIRRRKEEIEDAPVIEMFLEKLEKQCENVMAFFKVSNNAPEEIGEAKLWRGSSTNFQSVMDHLNGKKMDIVITSPPYATALPYIDTNRLSMLVLNGFNAEKRAPLEAEMTGTREIKKSTRAYYEEKISEGDFKNINSRTAKNIIEKVYLQNVDANVGFRRKNMAALLYMYFQDMSNAMQIIDAVVKKGGYICIVIGDNKTTTGKEKVIIRTTEAIRELGINIGWELFYDIPISVTVERYVHMNNSITENNILVFRKGDKT